jgi:SagB-type dehydrogenase family enzyme
MRLKRSSALVIRLENDEFVFHNVLGQKVFTANQTTLDILRRLYTWTDIEGLFAAMPGYSRESIVHAVRQLMDLGVVLDEDSAAADLDDDFATNWLWGPLTAAYHFGTRDGDFISAEDGESLLRQQVKFIPSPPLFTRNAHPETDVALPLREDYPEPFLTMARRRTDRIMIDAPITLEQLADCLQFSLAITALIEDPEIVDLPLKMTPSGGGRNPYEGYVCARRVEGLAPGTYHYSAIERTLGVVSVTPPPAFGSLVGNQEWASTASAVIFLVANFDRPMWKYHHPAAYRVTVLEAGHIAQNISLVATAHGLVANPTAALSQDLAEKTLGVGGVTQSVIYALVLGVPAAGNDTV